MLINYKISSHLSKERIERIAYIGTTMGFGEVVYSFPYGARFEAVTDTGVLIILSQDKNTVITMYPLSYDKAVAIFSNNGFNAVPSKIYQIITKNDKKGFLKNCP